MTRLLRLLMPALLAVSLAGCVVYDRHPHYRRPPPPPPPHGPYYGPPPPRPGY